MTDFTAVENSLGRKHYLAIQERHAKTSLFDNDGTSPPAYLVEPIPSELNFNKHKQRKNNDVYDDGNKNSTSNNLVCSVRVSDSQLTASTSLELALRSDSPAITDVVKMTAMRAVVHLAKFESMPLRDIILTRQMPAEQIWRATMYQFDYAVRAAAEFAKHLSAFASLPMPDRQHLLKNSIAALIIGQVTLPSNRCEYPFMGMSKHNQEVFFTHCPPYRALMETIMQIQAIMAEWNPTFLEFAVLQATIFFKYDPLTPKLTRPDLVGEAHRRMAQALVFSHEQGANAVRRMDYFVKARRLLLDVEQQHLGVVRSYARQRPDVFEDQLYREVYGEQHHQAETYLTQVTQFQSRIHDASYWQEQR